jgi:hypothetical protein
MSSSEKPANSKPKANATGPSPGLGLDDFQKMSEIFRAWADDSKLKGWIIAAGVGAIISAFGAVIETLHIFWLAVRYLKGF